MICNCPVCGKEFVKVKKQKYCSKQCSKKQARKEGKYYYGTGVCEVCGKSFPIRTYGGQRCCSRECNAIRRANERNIGKEIKEKIVITTTIPVFEHLRPKVGHIYEGRRSTETNPGSAMFWIVDIDGNPIVVRAGECRVIGVGYT